MDRYCDAGEGQSSAINGRSLEPLAMAAYGSESSRSDIGAAPALLPRTWEPTAGQIVYWVGPFFERVRQSNREGIQFKAGGKDSKMTQALVYWLGGMAVLFLAFTEVVQLF